MIRYFIFADGTTQQKEEDRKNLLSYVQIQQTYFPDMHPGMAAGQYVNPLVRVYEIFTRHFIFKDETHIEEDWETGDQERLNELTNAKIQVEHFPDVDDPNVRRPKYTNPLVHVYDIEK